MSSIIKSSQVNLLKNKYYYMENVTSQSPTDRFEDEKTDHSMEYENIISVAKKQAKDILNDAIAEAASIKSSVIKDAEEELEKIKKESYESSYELGRREGESVGRKEGFESGFKEGQEESEELIRESEKIRDQAIKERDEMLENVEAEVVELVLNIAETVLNKKLKEDDHTIVNLVMKGLESLSSRENIRVRVSADDFDKINSAKEEILSKVSLIDELHIDVDSNLKSGDCIIESSKGDVDVSVNTQLKNIEESIKSLLDSE